ncbi:MAG: NAD(+)/NADH kinase [Armatimonadia bacterium]
MVTAIRTIGLTAAPHKPRALDLVGQLYGELQVRGVGCVVDEALQGLCEQEFRYGSLAKCAECDLILVLGGDGTLLAAAREAAPTGTPLLGVDLGSFGFLSAEDPDLLIGHLDKLLAGDFEVERRTMLTVHLGGEQEALWALNDVTLAKNVHGRMIRVRTTLDGDHLATYPADGLIIATSTGSTAYNLSAGGPIIDSRMAAMVLTPICPHTLYSRPLVVPAEVEIALSLEATGPHSMQAALLVDGQEARVVKHGETVLIRRAPQDAKLVRLGESRFYEQLREKLRWGAER